MGQPLVLHLICWQQNPRKPKTQCFVLGIAGMGGNSGLYKLVSSSCSPYTLSTLGKECPQIFQYLLVLFVLVRLHKVAVHNYLLRTYVYFQTFWWVFHCFHYFLGTFWASNFDVSDIKWLLFPATGPPGCPLCRLLRRCLFVGSLHWSPAATLDHRTASGSRLVARFLFGSFGHKQKSKSKSKPCFLKVNDITMVFKAPAKALWVWATWLQRMFPFFCAYDLWSTYDMNIML